jgi:hypothetical protein
MANVEPSWTRLEPSPRDPDRSTGLRAEIHDPLWLLTRQLQLRELRGQDAGSPVWVTLQGQASRLTRYRPGPLDGTPGRPYDGRRPLEAVVEAEPVGASPLRLAAAAGLHFLRLLDAEGVGRYADAYRRRYPLTSTDPAPTVQRFLAVLAGRVPDGAALQRDLAAAGAALPAEPAIEPDDIEAVSRATRVLLRWYRALAEPDPAPAWVPARFEYQLAVAGPSDGGEVVLAATEYDRGRLDWSSFHLTGDSSLGAATDQDAITDLGRVGLPSPVIYRGMPAARFWEFEDAAVDFGDLGAAPEELAKLLLIEFAVAYGNDHFVVPVDVTVGSICHVRDLTVIDTFGRETKVPHVAKADAERPGTFRLFELGTGDNRSPLFLLPPVLAQSLDGQAIEEVRLLRDEGANLAWAVEATAYRSDGFPVDRAGAWRAGQNDPADPPAGGAPSWRYRLRTAVPEHWFPLVPVADRPGVNHLELGSLAGPDGSPGPPPWGQILVGLEGVAVPEEEAARSGAGIIRAWQYARWTDGRQHAWIGRRRKSGAPEGDSGLRFDVIEPSVVPPTM